MPRMYHKDLPDGQNIIEVDDANVHKIKLREASGWTTEVPKKVKEAESANAEGKKEG